MTTSKKSAAHVSITYAVCMAAAALAIVGVQYMTRNAVNQTVAGLLIPVLAQGLALALKATGQVDVPDAPAQVDVSALVDQLLSLVEVSASKGAATAVQAALAPSSATPSPDTHEAGGAAEPTPAPAATAA